MRPDPEQDQNHAVAAQREPSALDRAARVVIAGYRNELDIIDAGFVDSDPAVRAAALGALARTSIGDDDRNAATWNEASRDSDATVRRRAALAAPLLGVTSAALVSLLADPDDRVVEAACFAAGELEPADHDVVSRLLLIIETHDDSLCREAAVGGLGSLGVPEGLPGILRGCGDKATVRRRAVLALAHYDSDEVTAMLRHMTTDRDLQVRQSAEDLLAISEGHEIGSEDALAERRESVEGN